MFHFVSPVRVPLLLWTILMASSSSGNIKVNLADANVISSFLEKIIKPYIENNQITDEKSGLVARIKTKEDLMILNDIENAIRLKVIQLNPMLQDNYNTRKKPETLHSNKFKKITETDDETDDETTIIEFVPERNRRTNAKSALGETKQDTEKNIEKYKQLRQNITLLLGKENTSRLTNKLITKTLDEMLSLLIQGQCKWKSVDSRNLLNQLLKNTRKSMENMTDQELDQYKLTCYMRRRDKDGKPGYNDDHGYSGYSLIKSRRTFGGENDIGVKNQCHSFIVCSEELRHFLKLTHKNLNDTAVSTFTNYAAMYIRDIQEKTSFVNDDVTSSLYNVTKSVEKVVNLVFQNELEHFTLDTNKNKAANIKHINNFITAIAGQTKNNLTQFVDDKMTVLDIKFIQTIKDDLRVNLKMDMDNFSQQFKDKICEFFTLCNAKNIHETTGINKLRLRPKDPENVYVKVQVSFDDELKDSLIRFGEENLNSWQRDNTYQFGKRLLDAIGRRKYSNVNVTRTTISSTATTDGIVSSENGVVEQFFK